MEGEKLKNYGNYQIHANERFLYKTYHWIELSILNPKTLIFCWGTFYLRKLMNLQKKGSPEVIYFLAYLTIFQANNEKY